MYTYIWCDISGNKKKKSIFVFIYLFIHLFIYLFFIVDKIKNPCNKTIQ